MASLGSEIESTMDLEKLFRNISSQFSSAESEVVVESLKRNYGGKFNLLDNQDLLSCLQLLEKHGYVSDKNLTLIEEFIAPKSSKEEHIKRTIQGFKAPSQTRVQPVKELQGRQDEIRKITRELETGKSSVVNLFGTAGVGKTTIANEVFSKWKGKHFVFDLREAKDMKAIYLNMMNSLEIAVSIGFINQNYIVGKIHEKIQDLKSESQPVLFLLDNVEQFTSGHGKEGKNLKIRFVQFLEKLSEFKGKEKKTSLKLLLTSRSKLQDAKTVENFEVKSLGSSFSEKILISKGIASVNTDQKNKLIDISKGKPLLLKGLAAILRQERKSADDLIAGVQKERKSKSEEDAKEKPYSFEQEAVDMDELSTIREMFETLPTENLRRSAVSVSLFCGPFSASTAAKILGISVSEAVAQLEGLVTSAIIFVVDEEAKVRKYDIHPLLRKYAESIKNDAIFQEAYLQAKVRFHEHFMSKMKDIAKLIEPDYVEAFKRFEFDRPNYELTLDISLQPECVSAPGEFHANALIASLFNAMLTEDKQIKLFHSWAEICEDDGQAGSLCRAQLKIMEARQVLDVDGTEKAFDALEEASRSLDKVQNKSSESYRLCKGLYLHQEGEAYWFNRDYKRSLESLEASLEFTEKLLKVHTDVAKCYNAIGNCQFHLRKPMEALDFYKIAYHMQQELAGGEYHIDMPMYKNQIGTVYESQADYDKAVQWYKEALKLLDELKLSGFQDEAFFCRNLANALMFQNKFSEAVEPADRAYNIRMKILGDHPLTIRSIFQRAVIQANFGDYKEALKLFLEAWEMEKSVGAGNHSEVWRKIIEGVEDMYDFLAKGFIKTETSVLSVFFKKENFKKDALKFCQRFWEEEKNSAQFGFTELNRDIIDAVLYLAGDKKDKYEAERDALWFYDGMLSATEEVFQMEFDQETDNSALNEMLKKRDELLDKVIELCLQVADHEKLAKHKAIKLALYKNVLERPDFVGEKDYSYDKLALKAKVEKLYQVVGQKEKIPEFRENLLRVWQKQWEEGKRGEKTKEIGFARERTINGILHLCKELKKNEMYRRNGREALSFYHTWEEMYAEMEPRAMKKFLSERKELARSIGERERVMIYDEALRHLEEEEHLAQVSFSENNKDKMYFPGGVNEALRVEGKHSAAQEKFQGSLVPSEIHTQGHRAEVAYRKALQNGSVPVYRGRLMLLGQFRAGKTSLRKTLLGIPFNPDEESTVGVEIEPSKCVLEVEQVKNWQCTEQTKLDVSEFKEDIAKMIAKDLKDSEDKNQITTDDIDLEQKQAPKKSHPPSTMGEPTPGSNLEVIYFPNTNVPRSNVPVDHDVQSTMEVSQSLPNDDTEKVKSSSNSEIMQDHSDMLEIDIMADLSFTNDVYEIAKQYLQGLRLEEDTKTKEVTLSVWDFAGQHVYYASHPVFLTLRAVYVLVHNLSKDLCAQAEPCAMQRSLDVILENATNHTNLDNLLSWLVSLHCIRPTVDEAEENLDPLRPRVFVVGTHADQPFAKIKEMEKCIKESVRGKKFEKHIVRPFFAVDNTGSLSDYGVKSLQKKIMEVLKQEPYFGEAVPIRWFHFEKVVEALVKKGTFYMDIDDLLTNTKRACRIYDEEELSTMFNFYHDLGVIVKHGRTVVLQAQWLIDMFKQLITVPPFDEEDPRYSDCWQELEENGVLRMALVDHVFSNFIQKGLSREDILSMMELYGLIAKFSFLTPDGEHEERYIVPAQLRSSSSCLDEVKLSDSDPCPLYLDFLYGFVPHGLFVQLLSRCIKWCSECGPRIAPNLFQNGARFFLGKQAIFELILICRNRFIKVMLRSHPDSPPSTRDSATMATKVLDFLEDTLQDMSRDLAWLRHLKYKVCVACPRNCECIKHRSTSCPHDDCLHLLPLSSEEQFVCQRSFTNEPMKIYGLQQWLLRHETEDLPPSSPTNPLHRKATEGTPDRSDTVLRVTHLASEWRSSKGGLSTINRQLATLLAKHKQVEVTFLVPQFSCSEEDKRAAESHNVSIREIERHTGYDPLDLLSFPPSDLAIDIVIGHGAKLGKQAQVIRKSHSCQWVQVVHTEPEELGMYKGYPKAIAKGEEKNRTEVDLCKLANLVVAVGPKLTDAYRSYLRFCKENQDIIELTPGTFSEFSDVKQAAKESNKFKVLTFGRGDSEDFSIKGYDIAARAIVELNDRSYRLILVGAPKGEQDEAAGNLLKSGISKDQLTVRQFVTSRERLKELFCEADLAIMPSRTEGFGLTALEALSAGLPILVSGNSGFGDALRSLPLGKPLVLDSNEPKDWAKAIRSVRLKDRAERLAEVQRLRTCYEMKYSWERQCEHLVEKMWSLVHGQRRKNEDCNNGQTTSEAALLCSDMPGQMFQTLQQMQQHSVSKVNSSENDLSVKLKKIASDKGFVVSDNHGSGNCLFYALSDQLELVKGIKISHKELRQSVVQFLRKNPQTMDGTDLFNFVDGYRSWTDYLSKMAQDGTWGDHVIVYAAANCYDTCIHVISSLPHHQDLTITPDRQTDRSRPLVLGHIHELHYVSLQPKQVKHWSTSNDELEVSVNEIAGGKRHCVIA